MNLFLAGFAVTLFLEVNLTLARIATGIPGLDEVLQGGLLAGGVYLVRGEPGSGKTIFANQLCFNIVAVGGKAGYVTLLAESHARMLEHMEGLSFFRADAIPADVYYVSAFSALRDRGLPGVVELLSAEMRTRKVDLLVLDGLVTVTEAAGSVQELKLFVSELQVYSSLMGCTILLLNSVSEGSRVTPEQTMVDGIFTLHHVLSGSRHERTLEVVKFRGAAVLDGTHALRIGKDGITVFPRLEASLTREVERLAAGPALSTGVVGLDGLSQAGGYPRASLTAAEGAAGSGKTLMGLHFIGQATVEEPGILFGFDESPALLIEIASNFGIDLQRLRDLGALEIVWPPFATRQLDELGYGLLRAVERTGCKRLFIDGLGGFLSASSFKERGTAFLAALANELRRQGTTTLIAVESFDPQGFAVATANHGISAMADNVVRLRIEEQEGRIRRLISIGKMRGSRIELSLLELHLSSTGLQVLPAATHAEAVAKG